MAHDICDGETCLVSDVLLKELRPHQPDQARCPVGTLEDIMCHCFVNVRESIFAHRGGQQTKK
jgi:hypothetical protein